MLQHAPDLAPFASPGNQESPRGRERYDRREADVIYFIAMALMYSTGSPRPPLRGANLLPSPP
jgi:hypothetical protein